VHLILFQIAHVIDHPEQTSDAAVGSVLMTADCQRNTDSSVTMPGAASVILCTAGYDHTIKFWEAPTGRCYRTLQYTESQVNSLCITPNKKFLAVAGNPHVRLFEIATSNPNPVCARFIVVIGLRVTVFLTCTCCCVVLCQVTSFDGHTSNVTSVGFQKDCKWMYTGSEDGTVKIWDIRAPGYQRDYQSKSAINTVALHPNQVPHTCFDSLDSLDSLD
jgi:G protein beta subunit-like protein